MKLTEMTSAQRKQRPMARGLLDYFPDALAEVAYCSFVGNQQHNPGEELHWAKEKSTDHADCIARHLAERGTMDKDGVRQSAKVAWRALAMLQIEIEAGEIKETPSEKPGAIDHKDTYYTQCGGNFYRHHEGKCECISEDDIPPYTAVRMDIP